MSVPVINKEVQRVCFLLDSISDGVYIINRHYKIEFMNKAMIKNFGNGTGKKCHEAIFYHPEKCSHCNASRIFGNMETVNWQLALSATGQFFDITDMPFSNSDGTISKLSLFKEVTKAKEAKTFLQASELDYARLFDLVEFGIYRSSRKGKFLNANRSFLSMLGCNSIDELLRMDIARDVYVYPEDRTRFQQIIEKDGHVIDYQVDFKRKDKAPLTVLLTSHVRCDHDGNVFGYEGIVVDQSQRKLMEKNLKKANDFLISLTQSTPNAVIASDMKGNIILWNQSAEEIFGYKAEDVIGKMNIEQVYPENVVRQVIQMMRSDEFGGVGKLRNYPLDYVRQDGKTIRGYLTSAFIYDEEKKEVAFVGTFVDLEERFNFKQLAYELNNPIYGFMNTLELMKTEILPDNKRRKILDLAISETERVAAVLRRMISASKPGQLS
jgi:PAS domain S-box-containing protein